MIMLRTRSTAARIKKLRKRFSSSQGDGATMPEGFRYRSRAATMVMSSVRGQWFVTAVQMPGAPELYITIHLRVELVPHASTGDQEPMRMIVATSRPDGSLTLNLSWKRFRYGVDA